MKYFSTDHLPNHLAAVVKPFADVARRLYAYREELSRRPGKDDELNQIDLALQLLVQAKDAAVRGSL